MDNIKQPSKKWSTKKKLLVGLGVTALAVGIAAAVIFGGAPAFPALATAADAITTFATATVAPWITGTAAPWITAAATNLWAGTTGLAATLGVVGTTAQAAAAGVAIGAAVIGGATVLKTIASGISSTFFTSDRDRLHKHLVKAEKYAERTPGAIGIGRMLHKSQAQLEQPSNSLQNRVTQSQGRSAYAR